jgi:hypothetical protein
MLKALHLVKDDGFNLTEVALVFTLHKLGCLAAKTYQLSSHCFLVKPKLMGGLTLGHAAAKQAKDFLVHVRLSLAVGVGGSLPREVVATGFAKVALDQAGASGETGVEAFFNDKLFTLSAERTHFGHRKPP